MIRAVPNRPAHRAAATTLYSSKEQKQDSKHENEPKEMSKNTQKLNKFIYFRGNKGMTKEDTLKPQQTCTDRRFVLP